MARGGELSRYFEAVHPHNGTPYRALALLAAISTVVPSVTIAAGVTIANAMNYLMQIASFGFLGAYLMVCLAAPVYLAAKGRLGFGRVALAILTFSILGAVFLMSLVPVPKGPSRYLPYIFASLLAAGLLISRSNGKARREESIRSEASANSAVQLGDTP